MRKSTVATKTIPITEDTLEILLHLFRRHTLYVDVGGSAFHVLGLGATANELVVDRAPAPAIDPDWSIEFSANDLQNLQKLTVHGCKTTPARTGEFLS